MNATVPADTVPDYQSLMLPVLRAAAAGERALARWCRASPKSLG